MNMTVQRLASAPSVAIARTGGALVLALLMVSTAGCGSKGSSGGTGGSVGTGGVGGTSGCSAGSEGCSCYGNDTCNSGLSCLSHLCVNLPGSGGATGTGGAISTGGATGTGGAVSTGGATGTGGAISTGGATGTGGAVSTGGATGTGGAVSTGGATGTGGAVSTGGATGTGGAVSTGGATGTGGAVSAGGTSGGPLQFTGGYVASTTNSYGIQGAVYTFDDGAGSVISPDCTTGAACFGGTTTPTSKFCVNGSDVAVALNTTMTDYDYATYWGAAVGFDLELPDERHPTDLPRVDAPRARLLHDSDEHRLPDGQGSVQLPRLQRQQQRRVLRGPAQPGTEHRVLHQHRLELLHDGRGRADHRQRR